MGLKENKKHIEAKLKHQHKINKHKYEMTKKEIKFRLIKAGIKNLKEFGYPSVNEENILTDIVYSAMFKSMLNDNVGKSTKQVDGVIDELLKQIKTK